LQRFWPAPRTVGNAEKECEVPERYELSAPEVIADLIDGEAVAIDLITGRYHRLRGASAEVWEALIRGATEEEILASAAGPIDPKSLSDFVVSLCEESLLRERSSIDPVAVPAWEPGMLELESFVDLEDILGIDPIHEVDPDRGWPHAPDA
jgi:hypothetical protein